MKKEIFIPYLSLCRHYFDVVDALVNADSKSDLVSVTIYQKELFDAASHLMDYSKALRDSIIHACVEDNLSDSDVRISDKFKIKPAEL